MGNLVFKQWLYDHLEPFPTFQRRWMLKQGTSRHPFLNESKHPEEVLIFSLHPSACIASGMHFLENTKLDFEQARKLGFCANNYFVRHLEDKLMSLSPKVNVTTLAITPTRVSSYLEVPSPNINHTYSDTISLTSPVVEVPYATDSSGRSIDGNRLQRFVVQFEGGFPDIETAESLHLGSKKANLTNTDSLDNPRDFIRAKFADAQNIFFCYPSYWGGCPALAQAIIEQCACVGESYVKGGKQKPMSDSHATKMAFVMGSLLWFVGHFLRHYIFHGLWRDKQVFMIASHAGPADGGKIIGVTTTPTEVALMMSGAAVHKSAYGCLESFERYYPPQEKSKFEMARKFDGAIDRFLNLVSRRVSNSLKARQQTTTIESKEPDELQPLTETSVE